MRMFEKPLKTLADHHKHVMDLTLNGDESRFLSAGIDKIVKIYSTATYENVHTLTYPEPIFAIDIAKNDKYLAVGLANNSISVKFKSESKQEYGFFKVSYSERKRAVDGSLKSNKLENEDIEIKHKRKEYLSAADQQLKKFNHTEALKEAINSFKKKKKAEELYSLLFELERRQVLDTCLKGIDLRETTELLRFVHASFCNPAMFDLLVSVYDKILTLHGGNPDFVKDKEVEKILIASSQKVDARLRESEEMDSVMALMELLEASMTDYYRDLPPVSSTGQMSLADEKSSNSDKTVDISNLCQNELGFFEFNS